jgi:hypothetical protein
MTAAIARSCDPTALAFLSAMTSLEPSFAAYFTANGDQEQPLKWRDGHNRNTCVQMPSINRLF